MNAQKGQRTQSIDEHQNSIINKYKELYNIVILAAQICDAEGAFIALADEDDLQIKVKIGPDLDQLSATFFKHSNGVCCIVPDAMNDSRFAGELLITNGIKIRFFAGFPLTADGGSIPGSLCVIDREPKNLDTRQRQLMQLLSVQIVRILGLERRLSNRVKKTSGKRAKPGTNRKTAFIGPGISYLLLDRDLKVIAFNDEFSPFLNAIHAIADLGIADHIDCPHAREFYNACSKALTGTSVQIEQEIEYQNKLIWCRLIFTPVFDSGKDVAGVFFSGENITKAVELRQKLFMQNRLLEKIITIQSNELSGIAASITELMKIFKSEDYTVAKEDLLLMQKAVHRLDENIRLIVNFIV